MRLCRVFGSFVSLALLLGHSAPLTAQTVVVPIEVPVSPLTGFTPVVSEPEIPAALDGGVVVSLTPVLGLTVIGVAPAVSNRMPGSVSQAIADSRVLSTVGPSRPLLAPSSDASGARTRPIRPTVATRGPTDSAISLREFDGKVARISAQTGVSAESKDAATLGVQRGVYDGGDSAATDAAPAVPVEVQAQGRSGGQRDLESIRRLKVGTYNVLNLFDHVGKWTSDPKNRGQRRKEKDGGPKAAWALAGEAKAILDSDLDILAMEEVEDIQALNDFNERFLGDRYRTLLIEGNDERGIDIGFLVKKDIPFEIEYRTHKDETWVDPILGGGPKTLFSRDLPALIVRAPGRAQPLFVMFGTHYKSKRTRDPEDPESRILAKAQADRSAEIVERYREEFGADAPILFAGDFNGVAHEEPEFRSLFEKAGLTDSFDLEKTPVSAEDRITHTYHPKDGPAHLAQMDAVLVSSSLKASVLKTEVYRYRYPDGTVKPIPKTFDERKKNPSDHFPVVVTLDFPSILHPGTASAATGR